MRPSLATLAVISCLVVAGCSSAAAPTPEIIYVTPAPTAAPPSAAVGATSTAAPTPTPTPVPTPKPTPALTESQLNAIAKAQDYLNYTAFSRSGLIDQLVFEGFTKTVSTFAVDSLRVDWNEQSYLKAQDYLAYSSFSLPSLIDQLVYEGFTEAQAKYGATKAYGG